jgi:acyl-coenzyme A thioesterase PaaI-like protein
VHGGIISLLIDEGLGWAAYESLVHHTGQISKEFTIENTLVVTANLDIDFRSPFMAGSKAVIRVCLDEDRTTGRKMYFVAKLESLDGSVVFAEATGLFLCVPREKMLSPP